MYAHHGIFRSHKHRLQLLLASDETQEEVEVQRQMTEFVAKDRQSFYAFTQEMAIDLLSQLLANNLQTSSATDKPIGPKNITELMQPG